MPLTIDHYPANLGTNDLEMLQQLGFRAWETAPTFGRWLVLLIQAEQIRRLENTQGRLIEVEMPALPVSWSNKDLAEALPAVAAISYCVTTLESGRFADKLVITLNAIIQTRLLEKRGSNG